MSVPFESKVLIAEGDGCWLWMGYRMPRGYGQLSVDGRRVLAHRRAWVLANGPIPDGSQVLHRCDNPPCVRPSHLFLGTHLDNIADRHTKGREAKGDRHGTRLHPESVRRGECHSSARLTADQAARIRSRYGAPGETCSTLAAEFGVSRSTIERVGNEKLWRTA